jgi:DNA-directed RNA polymerase subunit L
LLTPSSPVASPPPLVLCRIPHPLKYEMQVRIQTDGSQTTNYLTHAQEQWTPGRALSHAISNLEEEFDSLRQAFEDECRRKEKEAHQAAGGRGQY